MLEIATLSLGALTAVALTINAWLVLLVLLPLLVLHRADMARQLEQRAATDGKTGLLNAAAWHEQAERALHRAQRSGGAAGVLILDLDHFKSVNDTYGHLAGDEVLVAVAEALRPRCARATSSAGSAARSSSCCCATWSSPAPGAGRWRPSPSGSGRASPQLAVAVQTPDGPLTIGGLSTSVGGVFHLGRTSTLQQVLGAADAALYTAKREGRNLVRYGLGSGGVSASLPPDPARSRDGAEPDRCS